MHSPFQSMWHGSSLRSSHAPAPCLSNSTEPIKAQGGIVPGVRAGAMKVVVVRTHPAFLDEAGVEPDTPPAARPRQFLQAHTTPGATRVRVRSFSVTCH